HGSADAYQRILLDGMRGDQTLFAREDAVELSWQFMQPILDAAAEAPVPIYPAATWGPPSSDALLAKDDKEWRKA
ncbi:MAG TPA: glucose-6-phosphate dehydrogenase, partial [bacterium]|nr:glucose-6-phosphate dehydrogenase [bacterium]